MPPNTEDKQQNKPMSRKDTWVKWFTEMIADWKYFAVPKGSRNFISKAELARFLGVEASTINKWLVGQTLPDQYSCGIIAQSFNLDLDDVLVAAGHMDKINPFESMRRAVMAHSFTAERREEILSMLSLAESEEWQTEHPSWYGGITALIAQKIAPEMKADMIAAVVQRQIEESQNNKRKIQ